MAFSAALASQYFLSRSSSVPLSRVPAGFRITVIRQKRSQASSKMSKRRLRSQKRKSVAETKHNGANSLQSAANKTGPTNAPNKDTFFFFSSPLLWYSHKLETHPLITKCLSSGFISGSGDLLCQYLVHHHDQYGFQVDWIRTGRFALLGFALVAPVVHVWYASLGARFPGTAVKQVAKRLLFDQGFFAPIFLPTFLVNLCMLEGRSPKDTIQKLQQDIPPSLITNWCLWIPAMMINFRYVPLKYQVLFSNMVGFVWNAYLSWRTQEEHGGKGGEANASIQ